MARYIYDYWLCQLVRILLTNCVDDDDDDDDDSDADKLQVEYQEQQECGHYDQYYRWLRQLEQKQAASRHAGLQVNYCMSNTPTVPLS